MFTTDTITGLIPALPRILGYQPSDVLTLVAVTDTGTLAGTATWRTPDRLTGETIHHLMRKMHTDNPTGQRVTAGLAVLWTDTDASTELDWLALDVATVAHPSAAPVTVVQAATDATSWRYAASHWQATDPDSPAVVAAIAAGYGPATGALADRLATWAHDPALAAAVADHTDRAWVGPNVAARRSIVDDVWAAMVAANPDPETQPDTLGKVIAALNGQYWLRDTIMLRATQQWSSVAATLAAAVRAADDHHLPNVAAVAAGAAYTTGNEMAGREALIRAVAVDPDHSLTALLDRAEAAGAPMTRTCRDVFAGLTEHTTLATGL